MKKEYQGILQLLIGAYLIYSGFSGDNDGLSYYAMLRIAIGIGAVVYGTLLILGIVKK